MFTCPENLPEISENPEIYLSKNHFSKGQKHKKRQKLVQKHQFLSKIHVSTPSKKVFSKIFGRLIFFNYFNKLTYCFRSFGVRIGHQTCIHFENFFIIFVIIHIFSNKCNSSKCNNFRYFSNFAPISTIFWFDFWNLGYLKCSEMVQIFTIYIF